MEAPFEGLLVETVSKSVICTYRSKSVGSAGVQSRGGDLTAKSVSSVGSLIKYLCSGVGTFDLFGRETGAMIKLGDLASSFSALLLLWKWCICRSHIMFRLKQVCEIHTKFKSQVVKGMCIACLFFGILPLGGDF